MPRKRAMARPDYGAFIAAERPEDTMLYWLAEAAREMRQEAGRKHVHVAAELGVDQSTISRFEKHTSQPESVDATVWAYADDLEIDPRQIWARGLQLWIANEQPEAEHAAKAVAAARQASQKSHAQPARKRRAKAKRPAAG